MIQIRPLLALLAASGAMGFAPGIVAPSRTHGGGPMLRSSPLDDFLGGIFGDDKQGKEKSGNVDASVGNDSRKAPDEEEMSLSSFQQELAKRQEGGNDEDTKVSGDGENADDDGDEFDGYALRDVIYEKWGECFDVEFQRVDSYGFRTVYLNIMPFRLGGKRFRHETELDYLCHLQAVAEILIKYDQLGYVLMQLDETKKKPRAGTSPLVAVPLRLDLTPEQVDKILG